MSSSSKNTKTVNRHAQNLSSRDLVMLKKAEESKKISSTKHTFENCLQDNPGQRFVYRYQEVDSSYTTAFEECSCAKLRENARKAINNYLFKNFEEDLLNLDLDLDLSATLKPKQMKELKQMLSINQRGIFLRITDSIVRKVTGISIANGLAASGKVSYIDLRFLTNEIKIQDNWQHFENKNRLYKKISGSDVLVIDNLEALTSNNTWLFFEFFYLLFESFYFQSKKVILLSSIDIDGWKTKVWENTFYKKDSSSGPDSTYYKISNSELRTAKDFYDMAKKIYKDFYMDLSTNNKSIYE